MEIRTEADVVTPGRFKTVRESGTPAPDDVQDWLHIYTFTERISDVANCRALIALCDSCLAPTIRERGDDMRDFVKFGVLEFSSGTSDTICVARPDLQWFFEPVIDFIETGEQIQPERLVALVTEHANKIWRGWDISARVTALRSAKMNPELITEVEVPEDLLEAFYNAFDRDSRERKQLETSP